MKKATALFVGLVLVILAVMMITGCSSLSKTVQKVSDDIGDNALQAHAFVDIWKVETSDMAANGAPVGKKITVIGDVKSIPLVSKKGAMVKDYAEYRKTVTPAWYNSTNVTTEETLVLTGDNAKELKALLLAKAKAIKSATPDKAEKETVTETGDSADSEKDKSTASNGK